MKNRMMVIYQFAEQEQNENIKEYTSDMIRKIDDIVKYSETGNYALDHLFIDLNIKYEKGCIFIHVKNRYEGRAMKPVSFMALLHELYYIEDREFLQIVHICKST